MKIAHVIQKYLPAQLTGSENYIRYISEGLVKRGYDVSVLTSDALDGLAIRDPIHGCFVRRRHERINNVQISRFRINHLFTAYPFGGFIARRFFSPVRTQIGNNTTKKNFQYDAKIRSPFYGMFGGMWELLTTLYIGPFTPMMYHHIRNSSYDLVHVTPFPLTHAWLAAEAARKASIPLVCTPFMKTDQSFLSLFNRYFRAILVQANAIIACTAKEKEMISDLGFNPSKIHVIPMGVDPHEWTRVDGNRFRKEHDLENRFLVLFAGQKNYGKGIIHLLRAMRFLQKYEGQIALVAMGFNSPEWELEKKMAKNIKIVDLPYLTGLEKMEVFKACDVFVMPSIIDNFGIVYLEAWMCEKPVIGARVDFISDIIKDGVNGYTVEFGNVKQIAEKIEDLLESESLRKRLGTEGRKFVLANFTWSQILRKIESVYEQAISKRQ